MGNVMQIAREALAVFYFDFIFAFLSLPALTKVAARDTLFTHSLSFSCGLILYSGGDVYGGQVDHGRVPLPTQTGYF